MADGITRQKELMERPIHEMHSVIAIFHNPVGYKNLGKQVVP
jgi:hypothetical protein